MRLIPGFETEAGHITTTLLLGNTVLTLDEHPDEAAKIRADRSLLPAAIEESLRLRTPFNVLARATTTATNLDGTDVPADQLLPLARLEGRVVLEQLLDRYPLLRTDPQRPPTFLEGTTMTGVRTLPVLTSEN